MIATTARRKLTHAGALALIDAAIAKAAAMGQPQCIAVVDDGCNLVAFVRMDGAKVLSFESALHKAMTAASARVPTGAMEAGLAARLAAATGGKVTNLLGGLPIVVEAEVIGAIGVGSGTGEQDVMVGNAALAACGAKTFDAA